jgi:hypothetical protein
MVGAIDHDDLDVLVEMLEHERRKVAHVRNIVTGFCILTFVILVILACGLAVLVLDDPDNVMGVHAFWAVSILGTAGSLLVFAGGAFFNNPHCLRSIERALFCARRQRPKLVISMIKQIECSAKKDRQAWIDLAMSVAS